MSACCSSGHPELARGLAQSVHHTLVRKAGCREGNLGREDGPRRGERKADKWGLAGWEQVQGRKGKISARSRRSRRSVAEQQRGAIFMNQLLLICIFSIAVHPEVGRPQLLRGGSGIHHGRLLEGSSSTLRPALPTSGKARGRGEPSPPPAGAPPAPLLVPGRLARSPQPREGGKRAGAQASEANPQELTQRRSHLNRGRSRKVSSERDQTPHPSSQISERKQGRKAGRETRREGGGKGTGLVYKRAHALVTALSFSRVPICIE